jgi:hypothetical protein
MHVSCGRCGGQQGCERTLLENTMVAQFHESCNIKQDYVGMVECIDVGSFEVVRGWIISTVAILRMRKMSKRRDFAQQR